MWNRLIIGLQFHEYSREEPQSHTHHMLVQYSKISNNEKGTNFEQNWTPFPTVYDVNQGPRRGHTMHTCVQVRVVNFDH